MIDAAAISNDTANPLMPISNRVSDLVASEPCTKALATPLKKTLHSLHLYLNTDETNKKIKYESDYVAHSSRLMSNLRTCLENLKNNSQEKFNNLMSFFRGFGEKLPSFLKFINDDSVEEGTSIVERERRNYTHTLNLVTLFRKSFNKEIPNTHTFKIKIGKESHQERYSEFSIQEPENFLQYIELFAEKKRLSNQPLDKRGKMYFQLAYCLIQSLKGEKLVSTEVQEKFDNDAKLLSSLKMANDNWNSSSKESTFIAGNAFRELSETEIQDLNDQRRKRFPNDVEVLKLNNLIRVVNISRKLQALFPKEDNVSSSKEAIVDWAINFGTYAQKEDFYTAKNTSRSSFSSTLKQWNECCRSV